MLGRTLFVYRNSYLSNWENGSHVGRELVVLSLFPTKEWRRRMPPWAGPRCLIVISYKRMEEKDVMSDRTSSSLLLFPTEEWGNRMSSRTGPCCILMTSYGRMVERDAISSRTLFLFLNFLQKNGGGGCHPGQDLVKCFLAVDISVMWWHRPFELCNALDRHERDLQDPIRAVFSTAHSGESNDTSRNYLFYCSTHRLYNLPKFLPSLPNTT